MGRNIREEDIEEEDSDLMENPLELMTQAIKVHTFEGELNEDATLSDLSAKVPPIGNFTVEQIVCINLINSYLRVGRDFIIYSNVLGEKWGKEIKIKNPNERHFLEAKKLLMNRVNSLLILSRSVKGSPLKAFLTYGRDLSNKDLGMSEKRSFMDKMLGKKQKEEEMI